MNVHSGRQHERCGACKGRGGQKIVGDAVGKLRENVRRARRDDESISLLGKRYMVDGIGGIVEQVDRHFLMGKRPEGYRIDEVRGVLGHAHLHADPGLLKAADDLAGFICGDAAGNAQQHGFLRFCSLATHDDPSRLDTALAHAQAPKHASACR